MKVFIRFYFIVNILFILNIVKWFNIILISISYIIVFKIFWFIEVLLDLLIFVKKLLLIIWFKKKVEERSYNWDIIGSLGFFLSGVGVLFIRNK